MSDSPVLELMTGDLGFDLMSAMADDYEASVVRAEPSPRQGLHSPPSASPLSPPPLMSVAVALTFERVQELTPLEDLL